MTAFCFEKDKQKMGYRTILNFNLLSNGFIIILIDLVYLSCCSIVKVGASIHEYQNESFICRSSSFFFHRRSEGFYASKLHLEDDNSTSEDKPINGIDLNPHIDLGFNSNSHIIRLKMGNFSMIRQRWRKLLCDSTTVAETSLLSFNSVCTRLPPSIVNPLVLSLLKTHAVFVCLMNSPDVIRVFLILIHRGPIKINSARSLQKVKLILTMLIVKLLSIAWFVLYAKQTQVIQDSGSDPTKLIHKWVLFQLSPILFWAFRAWFFLDWTQTQ